MLKLQEELALINENYLTEMNDDYSISLGTAEAIRRGIVAASGRSACHNQQFSPLCQAIEVNDH
jgi:hypothetical protein